MKKGFTLHDPILLGIIGTLLVFGLFLLSSASVALSQRLYGDVSSIALRQIFAVLVGLAAFFCVQFVPYKFWSKAAFFVAVVAATLLVLVLIPGIGIELHGAKRWIGTGLFTFQPAEIAKLALVLLLAWWFARVGERVKSIRYGFFPFLAIMGITGALVVAEPDLGTFGIMACTALILYFVAGASWRELLFLVIAALLFVGIFASLEPYRFDRLKVFLQRDADPQGIGYQVRQASIAIGSGGFWGAGYGRSLQKFGRLPEPMGDSIFAVVAEEFGLAGSVAVIILFLVLLWRGILVARAAPDTFAKLLVTGIIMNIVLAAFINIGAISGLLPLTGVPLPFISYGGTAMVITLAGLGIVYQIAKQS